MILIHLLKCLWLTFVIFMASFKKPQIGIKREELTVGTWKSHYSVLDLHLLFNIARKVQCKFPSWSVTSLTGSRVKSEIGPGVRLILTGFQISVNFWRYLWGEGWCCHIAQRSKNQNQTEEFTGLWFRQEDENIKFFQWTDNPSQAI